MKKSFKKIMYRSSELTTALGCMAIYLAASSNDYGTFYGNGAPEWTWWGMLGGFVLLGIGVFLGSVREAANRTKNR